MATSLEELHELLESLQSIGSSIITPDDILSASSLKFVPGVKAIYLVKTTKGEFILSKEYSPDRIGYTNLKSIISSMRRLNGMGFPVPEIIGNIHVQESDGGAIYLQSYQSGTQNLIPTFVQACGIASIAARIHKDTQETSLKEKVAPEDVIPPLKLWRNRLDKVRKAVRNITENKEDAPAIIKHILTERIKENSKTIKITSNRVDAAVLAGKAAASLCDTAHLDGLEKFLDDLEVQVKKNVKDLPCSLVHCDFNPTNVLFDEEDKVTGLIDFEWSTTGSCVFDFAWIVGLLAAKTKNPNQFTFNLERMKAMVSIYNLGRQLTDAEKELIPALAATNYLDYYLHDLERYADLLDGKVPDKLTDLERRKKVFEKCLEATHTEEFKKSLIPGAIPLKESSVFGKSAER